MSASHKVAKEVILELLGLQVHEYWRKVLVGMDFFGCRDAEFNISEKDPAPLKGVLVLQLICDQTDERRFDRFSISRLVTDKVRVPYFRRYIFLLHLSVSDYIFLGHHCS